jgi:hypothetical protein
MRHRRAGLFWGLGILAVGAAGAGVAFAQARFERGGGPQLLPNTPYDGTFTFVRIRYGTQGFGRNPPWYHDYPYGETHFARILTEVSLTPTYMGGSNVLTFDDPELFKFPIAYIVEPGFWVPTPAEVEGLRAYLQKGGFLIVDDFFGNHWYNFVEQMRRVLPDGRLIRLDETHPIFDSFFRIESLDFWHPYQAGYRSEFHAIFEDNDPSRRILVIVNYNNDLGEYWEYSDTDWAPIALTNEAYKLGINYVIYALTR